MWEKIVLNLLSNALKFTLTGTIRVEVSAVNGHAQLSVSDTGVGMPAEELPHVFERFRRIRSMPSRSHEGSGIGLALTRELVRLHGGSIEAESEVGRGTTFRVTLPLGSGHLDPTQIVSDVDAVHGSSVDQYLADVDAMIGGAGAATPAPEMRGSGERARVLLADDNSDLRDYVTHVLSPLHDVVAVRNGAEALSAARSAAYDLIISDAMMPEIDGIALLEAVRGDEALAALPFIFLSAKAGEESAVDALRRGASDYLVKPFTGDQLVARVNAQLATARRQREFLSRKQSAAMWFERQGYSSTNEVAFREFTNQLPIPIWQQDIFGSISFTNRAWHELLHLPYDPSSHTAEAWKTIIHPDEFELTLSATTAAIESRSTLEINYRLKPSDGGDDSYRWYVARSIPQFDADGDFKGWIGAIMDVHEAQLREEKERRLRLEAAERERDLRALSEALPAIVWTATPDGAGEYFNNRMTEYTGLTSAEAEGNGWLALVHPDDVAEAVAAWQAATEAGTTYEVSYRLRRSDGEYRWFSVRGIPLRDAAGAIVRWIGTCIDFDEAKRSYDRERRASEAFQQAALPKALPSEPGVSFSAVYQAGSSEALVGGDWYDAFRLLDGRIVLSVGDVMGSGLDAAVMMSAVRQSIRGAAQIYPDPCAVLDAADRALRSGHPEALVTAFVGVFDPVGHSITHASAGHPPPFLRDDTGAIVKLSESGLPLGLRVDKQEQHSQTLRLPEKPSMLVLYTDGFTEATRDVDEGEQHLCRLMESEHVRSAPDPAREILAAIADRTHDDVAIMVVHFDALPFASPRDNGARPTKSYWRFDVEDDAKASSVRAAIVAELRAHGSDDRDVATAELLYSELIGNVVRHSGGTVEIALDVAQAPVLHVLDRGPGFTFTTRLPASLMNETGRGLFIVSSLAREFTVAPRQDGGSHARVVLPFYVASANGASSGGSQKVGRSGRASERATDTAV